MITSILTNPFFTFFAGIVLTLLALFLLLSSRARPNTSAADLAAYQAVMKNAGPGGGDEAAGMKRFEAFLGNVGNAGYVRENTAKVYAANAWLDDTLVIHHGAEEIEKYFVKTAETVTSFETKFDDISHSGRDWYVRWTMIFAAPALSGGKPVHSTGMSQVRFDQDGKVVIHKDFWDSGQNFYGHLPLVGGAIGAVRKRLEAE